MQAIESGVHLQWLGHACFRLKFDHEGRSYVIYIDPWFEGNPKCPLEKNVDGQVITPDDADLILISHGHFDHTAGAAPLLYASKKPDCKIACIYEIGEHFINHKGVDQSKLMRMNKSGSANLGFCKIAMTSADHSSSCGFHEGHLVDGGAPAGWIVKFPQFNDLCLYHAGDTGVFGDMGIINELYKPHYLLIPIGGNFTMGPEEAAFAIHKFFNHAHSVIPMHFGTFPLLPGNYKDFVAEVAKLGVLDKHLINSYEDVLNKWINLRV